MATMDQVEPLRFWDDDDVMQKIVMEFTYRFDDVLSPEKLKSSLERLLEIGEWRCLGARFKKNPSGKTDAHIPSQYNDERPGFLWSQRTFDQSIHDHPEASHLPVASGLKRPTLFPGPDYYHDLVTRPGHATKFTDFTESDDPALSVHVVSFKDATLLTLSWSHAFFDALGRQVLLKAWIAVLEGREEEVPKCVPFGKDPARAIAEGGDPRKHILYKYALTGFWFMCFVVGYIYEMVVHSAEAGRVVCCPGTWVEELRKQAMADVAAKSQGETDTFLSHGDVLLAWWAKVSLAAQNLSPKQPVNIMNVTNLRGLFPDDLPNIDGDAYIGNAVISSNTFVTCGELTRMSVGDLALRVRQDLQKQRTAEQASHFIAWQIESKRQTGRGPMLGPWNQLMFAWSNWHRARFFDMNFSAAVERTGTTVGSRANEIGQPSFILPSGHTKGLSLRNAGPLMGRDANGDWWLQWVLRANAWEQIEKHFESI